MKIGRKWQVGISNMLTELDLVNDSTCKYLRMVFVSSANFEVDCEHIKRNFYIACNSVVVRCK